MRYRIKRLTKPLEQVVGRRSKTRWRSEQTSVRDEAKEHDEIMDELFSAAGLSQEKFEEWLNLMK